VSGFVELFVNQPPTCSGLKSLFSHRSDGNSGGKIWTAKRMSKPPKPLSEEPRSEPEIIPPGQAEQSHPRMRAYTHRIYIGKPSPLGIILVTLIIGLLSAAMLVVLFGAFLFLLPLAVLFFTGVIVVGLLRFYFRGLWG